jgi:phage terminase large subunit GpA-like protein
MYFFPTRTDVLEFSKSRVSPLLADNPFLLRQMRDTDTAGLKRIGEAHLFLRGMQSNVGMKSVSADMVVFDERDEATPEAKTLAKERLSHSNYQRIIELSNPSLPAFGIDEAYQLSDQRHWTVKWDGVYVEGGSTLPARVGELIGLINYFTSLGYTVYVDGVPVSGQYRWQ